MIYSPRRSGGEEKVEESCAISQYTLSLPFFIVVVPHHQRGLLAYSMYSARLHTITPTCAVYVLNREKSNNMQSRKDPYR